MPTSSKYFSGGYKGKKPAPPRQSGGTSGNLSIPHYTPSTPTVPYNPAQPSHIPGVGGLPQRSPGHPAPTSSSPAASSLISTLSDLLTPGPSARETAEAAHTLGVKPIASAVASLTHDISNATKQLGKEAAVVAKLPRQHVDSFLGRKTLGTPTVGQILHAAGHHQTRLNKRGKLTIPATRQAARQLAQAKQQMSRSGRIEGITHGSEAERFAESLVKHSHLDPQFVGAWVQSEGGGYAAGGQAGRNNWLGVGYPGHPTALSQSPELNGSPEEAGKFTAEWLTGRKGVEKAGAGIPNILPLASGKGPEAGIQALAQSGWGTDVNSVRRNLGTISVHAANPKAIATFTAAKAQAQKLGIPTKVAPGADLERGGGKVVYVRADGKGMVDWAKALLGTQEGSRLQLKWAAQAGISAAEPWCSEFIAAGIARRGLPPPSNPAYSGTWLEWSGGHNIGTDLSKAKPGDILVFGPRSFTSHVGLYTGGGQMISGNFGDEVAQSSVADEVASTGLAGIVRPGYKGGKVAVHESTQLPGSALSPGGVAVAAPAGAAVGGGQEAPQPRVVSSAQVPISNLLSTISLAPQALSIGSSEEEPSQASGTIARILARKRL